MAFPAKILSWRFRHLNIVGCLLKKRPTKGGVTGTLGPPLATPLGRQTEEDGKTLVCDKHDRAITCVLCRDPHKTLIFSGLCKNICLKESEVWRKVISNKIIVTLVTQGLPSSFLSRTVA